MNEALSHTGAAPPANRPVRGFCFRFRTVDGRKRVFVNVCGHDDVGMPLGPSGQPVSPEVIQTRGVDNLQIPIAVGPVVSDDAEPTVPSSGPKVQPVDAAGAAAPTLKAKPPIDEVMTVEVILHTCITTLCEAAWRIGDMNNLPAVKQKVIARVVGLALDWVKREAGLVALPASIKVVTDMGYRPPRLSEASKHRRHINAAMDSVSKMTEEELKAAMEELTGKKGGAPAPAADEEEENPIAAKFKLPTVSSSKPAAAAPAGGPSASKKPLIVELGTTTSPPPEPVMKKGFLNRSDGPGLYGPEGTAEGVLPENAGDPLGYMPKSLRSKFKVVDARDGTPAAAALKEKREADEFLRSLEVAGGAQRAVAAAPSPVHTAPVHTAPPPTLSPIPRVTNGVVIEDIEDIAVEDALPWQPCVTTAVLPTDTGCTLSISVRVPQDDFAVTKMSQLDLEIQPHCVEARTAEGGALLFRVGDAADHRPRARTWCLAGPLPGGARYVLEEESASAKFVKSQGLLTIQATLRRVE
jgi:hypothetical protein